jgi:hypothetical protein
MGFEVVHQLREAIPGLKSRERYPSLFGSWLNRQINDVDIGVKGLSGGRTRLHND